MITKPQYTIVNDTQEILENLHRAIWLLSLSSHVSVNTISSSHYIRIQNHGTLPWLLSGTGRAGVVNMWSTSCSMSDLLAKRPLIRGRASAYAFLVAYIMVFWNFLTCFFSLYLRTRASLSMELKCTGVWSEWPESSTAPLVLRMFVFETSGLVSSGTIPTSIDEKDIWDRIKK